MLKLIGVLFDASSTMAAPYYLTSDNILKEPKSHSLIDILTKATKNNNTDVFSILFGCKKIIILLIFLIYFSKIIKIKK